MRFYEISGGSAKLDGKELSSLNVNNLRRQIGYVGQLPVLFNGSVRYNILLGNPDATEDEMISAAKAAHAHEFIMNLPKVSNLFRLHNVVAYCYPPHTILPI